jgi:uncharacterized FlaG/YvyC family protein
MAISPIAFSTPPPAPADTPVQAPSRATTREVAAAVQTLNQSGSAGPGRQFSIAIDGKTKEPVVRIVDSSTNELIEQIPSQYILDLAQQITRETDSNPFANGR